MLSKRWRMNNKPLLQRNLRRSPLGSVSTICWMALTFVTNGTEERLGPPAGWLTRIQTGQATEIWPMTCHRGHAPPEAQGWQMVRYLHTLMVK
jgi:hypothetical protein